MTTAPTSPDDFRFDETEAERACLFFPRYLRHVKGELAGKPLKLEAWQEDQIIRPLFGWKRADGTRRFRTAYIEIPRKNGKSTLCAGIALYLLFCDREPGAEVYSAAADRDQAAIVFEVAKDMRDSSPKLARQSRAYRRVLTVPRTRSRYKVLSADAGTKHGLNASGIIVDELHAHRNRELLDVLMTSTGSRRQPLLVIITTAGWDRQSIGREMHDYAVKVRDGIVNDPSFLSVIYGAEETDDWEDAALWAKANPGLGISVSRDYLADECRRAQEVPGYVNTFRRLHLNVWTETESRWLDMAAWRDCGGPVDRQALLGRSCYGGIDLSATIDVTALVLAFPDEDGGYTVLPFFWVPGENVEKRSRRDGVPYATWRDQGFLELTEGNVVDYGFIKQRILELSELYDIREIAFDRWNSSQLVTELMSDGAEMRPFGQGFASMAAPTRELERQVTGGTLRHGDHPVLTWMAANVVVQQSPAGDLKPNKAKSTERIDGIVAAIQAIGRHMLHEEDEPSVYTTRGLIVLGTGT